MDRELMKRPSLALIRLIGLLLASSASVATGAESVASDQP